MLLHCTGGRFHKLFGFLPLQKNNLSQLLKKDEFPLGKFFGFLGAKREDLRDSIGEQSVLILSFWKLKEAGMLRVGFLSLADSPPMGPLFQTGRSLLSRWHRRSLGWSGSGSVFSSL